jgi:hypothetical protein
VAALDPSSVWVTRRSPASEHNRRKGGVEIALTMFSEVAAVVAAHGVGSLGLSRGADNQL